MGGERIFATLKTQLKNVDPCKIEICQANRYKFCDFQEFLDQALRGQFIMGFRDVQNNIRALLLAETDLSFKRIIEVAQRISSSSAEAKLIAPAKPEIFRMALHSKSKPNSFVCYGCGENDHYRRDCPKQTERCGIKEHASKVCRKRFKDDQSINSCKRLLQKLSLMFFIVYILCQPPARIK
ncbi:hypothetical protein HZS_5936 [Henneguya salminicola]|nr:hypothetical protein HZS_5936 [Henneguya salminicola]